MKKTTLFLATAVLSIALISCGGKKEETATEGATTESTSTAETSGNSLEGTWEISKAEGAYADMNKGTQYIFSGDKMSTEKGIIKTPGKYTVSGDTIIFKLDAGNMEMRYTFKMEGAQLVVKPVGSDQTLYMDKK